MSTQKQSGLLRLRSHEVRLAVAVLLALMASVIPRNVAWAQAPKELDGEWQWRDGGYSGRLHITQNSDGSFSGKYDPQWRSTIEEGHIQGNQIEFVRLIIWSDGKQKEQRYKLTLDRSGNTLRMKGRWTGFDGQSSNGSGDFSAEKVSGPSALDISGTWICTVNNGNFYKARLVIHSAGQGKWNATGTNLETSADFHQVLVGKSTEVVIRSVPERANQFFYNVSGADDPNPSARGPWSQAYTGTLDGSGLHWQVIHRTADGRQMTWSSECVREPEKKSTTTTSGSAPGANDKERP